ncbi:catalase [Variovorax sp. J22P271]|uniref:catalase n=1 Tax=Variovorax davisae TaxID=3053515 RepID=UPI002575D0DF|nr:catalase [Variovorax sp. J22P271]MDM0032023.1 catalase [Variovorax sp. J22P271]
MLTAIPEVLRATGAPVVDNLNIQTAGPRGPALLQDIWLIERLAHFDREVIPERRMHAKGWAHGTFTEFRPLLHLRNVSMSAKPGTIRHRKDVVATGAMQSVVALTGDRPTLLRLGAD